MFCFDKTGTLTKPCLDFCGMLACKTSNTNTVEFDDYVDVEATENLSENQKSEFVS